MNFGQLQSAVQSAIIDSPPNVVARIPDFIRQALKDLQDAHSFKVCETVTPILTTTVNTRVLAPIPSNLARYRKKPVLLQPISGRVLELELTYSRDAVEREYGTAAGGEVDQAVIADRPRVLLSAEADDDGNADWEVYPLPDGLSLYTDGEYRIRVPYYRYLSELTMTSQTNWFTDNAAQAIIQQAAAYGFFEDHDNQNGTIWMTRARGEREKAIEADKKLRWSSISTMRVSPDARGRRIGFGDD